MIPAKYGIFCCAGEALAYLEVNARGSATITPAGAAHTTVAVNPKLDGESVWSPDALHEMVTSAAANRQVTEIDWRTHRSWVIRCGEGSCPQQVEVSSRNLRLLAQRLDRGSWPEVDGLRPLRLSVLNSEISP